MIKEREMFTFSGWLMIPLLIVGGLVAAGAFVHASSANDFLKSGVAALAGAACFIGLFGAFVIEPNEAKVLMLLGSYVGTVKDSGLRWSIPFYSRRGISLRVRNFESTKLKVNDREGSPIEIGAIVSWRVANTAMALFQVEDYQNFVEVQTEAAVRNLAMSYPYERHEEGEISLHGDPEKIAGRLVTEIQERLGHAGAQVLEARLSHLAYAPEIAAAMLQRQQARAIIGARQTIVQGAVGMVEMALEMLARDKVVQLDESQKSAMVSNLLVVLCSERATQPVLSTTAPA